MKTKLLLLMLISIGIAGCKKNNKTDVSPDAAADTTFNVEAALADGSYLPLTIKTIFGKNGDAFDYAAGIDVADDGSIYIAEQNADRIRRIVNESVVTTVPIPLAPDGDFLSNPMRVRVQKDGTINILTINVPHVVARNNMWIIKPNGQVFTPPFKPGGPSYDVNGRSYVYDDLQIDKRTDEVFISGVNRSVGSAIQKFRISPQGYLGIDEINPPADSVYLDPSIGNGPDVRVFYCGYNGVKYLVMNFQQIYKFTPSGVFTRIFRNLKFSNIHSIVGTKDGRTFYIVDGAALRRIVDGKLQYIGGPSRPFNRRDGVGVSADISPFQLALSKDEGTLYFTDGGLVRKVLLR
ncbi:MAG: hypothetical protein EOP46_15470 [Sphingobacteriaceae bacterium]|nr:MAG: hypothetical protein EOP46_15470 [Sphingobacteriaceae bacterium]